MGEQLFAYIQISLTVKIRGFLGEESCLILRIGNLTTSEMMICAIPLSYIARYFSMIFERILPFKNFR